MCLLVIVEMDVIVDWYALLGSLEEKVGWGNFLEKITHPD